MLTAKKLEGSRVPPLLLAAILGWVGLCYGQGYFSERNDEAYLILALKKQKTRFDVARSEYMAALELKKKDLISKEELERKKAAFLTEEITYQQAMLRVIFDQPHVVIEKAVKYQAEDGKKRVRLQLRNTTGGMADYEKLVQTDASVFDPSLQPDKINNVFISLHESAQTGGDRGDHQPAV